MTSNSLDYIELKRNLGLVTKSLNRLEDNMENKSENACNDIIAYLRSHESDKARLLVVNMLRDEQLIEAMDIIELYGDLVLESFDLFIEMHEPPKSLAEAIYGLVWACPFYSKCDELKIIANSFVFKYSLELEKCSLKDTLVQQHVSKHLMRKLYTPAKYLVETKLMEIARDSGIEYEPEALLTIDDNFTNNCLHDAYINELIDQLPIRNNEEFDDSIQVKSRLNYIIRDDLLQGNNLPSIKKHIEDEFRQALSTLDHAYIENKYRKYCTQFWFDEIHDTLTELKKDKNNIMQVYKSLDTITNLCDIPSPFRDQCYHRLLQQTSMSLEKFAAQKLVQKFKNTCLVQVVSSCSAARNEILFPQNFINYLIAMRNHQKAIAELGLKEFHEGTLTFDGCLLKLIALKLTTNVEQLRTLQEQAKCILGQADRNFKEIFKKMIGEYIQPVQIQGRNIDDRQVLEVVKKTAALSEVLPLLEKVLAEKDSANVVEIRFICVYCLHIDAPLSNEVWHGKNVVVVTNKAIVYENVTWDVSGKVNYHHFASSAGTNANGNGNDGANGYPGESGGNVLFLVKEMTNSESLTIISNGSPGTNGQHGGDGINGTNGNGIAWEEFQNKFQPVATLVANFRMTIFRDTVRNIKNLSKTYETVWYSRNEHFFRNTVGLWNIDQIISEVDSIEYSVFSSNPLEFVVGFASKTTLGNCYIKSRTKEGNEITFSFESGGTFTNCQAYFLYKGTPGTDGGISGNYGLGGEGGYSGEIIVINHENTRKFNVQIETQMGVSGRNGRAGKEGTPGKNGWDMGYMDYSSHPQYPRHFGKNENTKLTLYYSDTFSPETVQCPYRVITKKPDRNVQMKSCPNEMSRSNQYSNQYRRTQQQVRADKKKNISINRISQEYSKHLTGNTVESSALLNELSTLERIEQSAAQTLNTNKELQKSVITDIKVIRPAIFQNSFEPIENTTICAYSTCTTTTVDNYSDFLKNFSVNQPQENWTKLNSIELSLKQLRDIFGEFESLKGNSNYMEILSSDESMASKIEKLLLVKYRHAILHEIAATLENSYDNRPNLDANSAGIYLSEAKENCKDIEHPKLGHLSQYLIRDNQTKHNDLLKYLQSDEEVLTFVVNKFAMTPVNNSKLMKIKNFFTRTAAENSIKELLEQLQNSVHDESGPLFAMYREILACIFDVNIRLYEKDRHSEFFLISDHNQESKNCVYFLLKGEEFINLTINMEYFRLEKERQMKSNIYRQILQNIDALQLRLDFDNYLKKREFLQYVEDRRFDEIEEVDCEEDEQIPVKDRAADGDEGDVEEENQAEDRYDDEDEEYKIVSKIEILNKTMEKVENKPSSWFEKIKNYCKQKGDMFTQQPFNRNNTKRLSSPELNLNSIVDCFPQWERPELANRLQIIQQIMSNKSNKGNQDILVNVSERFSSDGNHISSLEIFCLINAIITSTNENRGVDNFISWITASYPQIHWLDELILMELESYYKKSLPEKEQWRRYLSEIVNKNYLIMFRVRIVQCQQRRAIISVQNIEDILRLLSSIPNETVSLESLGLYEWPYALKDKYWTCQLSKLIDFEGNVLQSALYYLLSMENAVGMNLVKKFLGMLRTKNRLSETNLLKILENFHNEFWSLGDDELAILEQENNIIDWIRKMNSRCARNNKERDLKQLVKLIESNVNTSKAIVDNIANTVNYITKAQANISSSKYEKKDFADWVERFRTKFQPFSENNRIESYIESLPIIDRAIKLTRGFKLRNTQKLAVFALLTNNCSTLAQVNTGEGKSLIVVTASIMQALRGEKVHIVTSSSVLAKRDASSNQDIYQLFDIRMSHNACGTIELSKEVYSCNRVIYGDLSTFQRDYLLSKFFGKNIFDCSFQNVIVDEVDSMLLDKGNNMLYLSHDMAGLDKLESVYIFIWMRIHDTTEEIKESVLHNIFEIIQIADIRALDSILTKQKSNILWNCLVNAKILDHQGKVVKRNPQKSELLEILPPEFRHYTDRLRYLIEECTARQRYIQIPNHLACFVEQHLENFVNSAKVAFVMKAGQDYVVDVDRSETSSDINPNITIIDKDTGTDQANSQWDEALHQFLQLKHGCKISLLSLKTAFVSNVSYFKLYDNMYGLTGTLGSQSERDLLKDIHSVDFVTIGTAKPKKFKKYRPIVCHDMANWIKCIHEEALKQTKNRSVLIICETVNDVQTLHTAFMRNDKHIENHIHTYTRDYEEFSVAHGHNSLAPGQIIIATNLAGRGTDIKITHKLRTAGGLHVCLTYLPNNIRIEQQAFGRAARCGEPGSGQLVILVPNVQTDSDGGNVAMCSLMRERASEELHRISEMKMYYETQITMEEQCLDKFKEQYEKFNVMLKTTNAECRKILLDSCLDKWAFWLDRHSKLISAVKDEESMKRLDEELSAFLSPLRNWKCDECVGWLAWVESNPIQMVKLAKYLSQNSKYSLAIQLFDEVIEQEPCFSEAAHYYKAFAVAKLSLKSSSDFDTFRMELREAAKLLNNHSDFVNLAQGVILQMRENCCDGITKIDAYEKQQEMMAHLYNRFETSIDDMLGHKVMPQNFMNDSINLDMAEFLFEDLQANEYLIKAKVIGCNSDKQLKKISTDTGISIVKLKKVLSKYIGSEINENLLKKFENEFQLPSQKGLWKQLIEQKVLFDNVKCIRIDSEKLREFDSSLYDSLDQQVNDGLLRQIDLKFVDNRILSNAEWLDSPLKESWHFERDNFMQMAGTTIYERLKKNRTLWSRSDLAHINEDKIKSVVFSCYDSIAIENFATINITTSEAKQILTELVERNVLQSYDSANSCYKLQMPFHEVDQLEPLLSTPIYIDAVKELMYNCFVYRINLQQLEKHQKSEKISSNQHNVSFKFCISSPKEVIQSLTLSCIEERIFSSVTVTTEKDIDFKKEIHNRYSLPATEGNLIDILYDNEVIRETKVTGLFNHLVEKGWITKENYATSVVMNMSLEDHYFVADAENRKKHPLTSFKDIELEINKVLDIRLGIGQKHVINNIIGTLKHLQSSLDTLIAPTIQLKPLIEPSESGNYGHLHESSVFFINGLDQLSQLGENKWALKNLIKPAICVAMGIGQICTGAVIQLFSAGIGTSLGIAFMSEGVNDIIFGLNATRTGSFSWTEYSKQKQISLMITAVTACAGIYWSGGLASVSKYGYKLGGRGLAHLTGKNLIQEVGVRRVVKSVGFSIGSKALEGLTSSLVYAASDLIIQNCIQSFLKRISNEMLTNIEDEVNKHEISKTLETAYTELGDEEANRMVNDLTDSYFTPGSYSIADICSRLLRAVTNEIGAAMPTGALMNSLNYMEHFKTILISIQKFSNVKNVTSTFLNNLNQTISQKIAKKSNCKTESRQENEATEMENFKRVVIGRWRGKLCEKATQDMEQYYARPLLETGLNELVRCVKNNIKKSYQSHKEQQYQRKYKKLQKKYRKKIRSVKRRKNRRNKATLTQTKNKLNEQYHTDLLKLQQNTRDPKLIASIVREGVPMDLTCVKAVAKLIPGGVVFNIKCDNVANKTICSNSSDSSSPVINLELRDNHYYLCDSNSPANTAAFSESYRNDCLYEGLCIAIPELSIKGADQFRKDIANCIENDPDIRDHIENGWHSYLFDHNAYGGRKIINDALIGRSDLGETSKRDVIATDKHIECRMYDVGTAVGVGQRISKLTDIPFEKIVGPGISEYQDARSGRGIESIDAAHVLRFKTDEDLQLSHDDRKELITLSSHTQLTDKTANCWGSIGADFDKLQENYWPKLANLNVLNPTKDDFLLVTRYFEECNKILSSSKNKKHGIKFITDYHAAVDKFFDMAERGHSGAYKKDFIQITTKAKDFKKSNTNQ